MGKSSGNSKVTNETKLPSWYTNAAKTMFNEADTAATNLARPYMGNTVADLDPMQKKAIGDIDANVGATNAAFAEAGRTAAGVANYKPGSFLTGNIDAYMNPYLQQVEQAALGNMDRAYKQNLNTIGDGAINARAFGGSRQGVAEGVAAAENARQMGDFSAQLRSSGFDKATNMMTTDMNRALEGADLNLRAAGMGGDLAATGNRSYLDSLNAALASGAITREYAQNLLDQDANRYDANRNYPMEAMNIRLAALGGTQVPTTSTTKTPTSGNWLTGAAGGALAGASMGPWGMLGGGLLGGIAGA